MTINEFMYAPYAIALAQLGQLFPLYGQLPPNGERVTDSSNGIVTANFGEDELGPRTYHRTDAGGYIGRIYRERGLGHRVRQVYCDSRDWNTANYPADFFDSVLIDGGHQPDVVI